MYQNNLLIILFGVTNLILFIFVILLEYKKSTINKLLIIIYTISSALIICSLMCYYAIVPLIINYEVSKVDKKVTIVTFDKSEYPDLASNQLATCSTDQFCQIKVVKFRVYPRHGFIVDLSISPIENLSIVLRPVSIHQIHFVLNQVILSK
jgi:hypothetical protein